MDQLPPQEVSALASGMDELQTRIEALQNDISNLRLDLTGHKREMQTILHSMSELTVISNLRYSQDNPMQSQEQIGVAMQSSGPIYGAHQDLGSDKNNPPLVPQGTELNCVRCGYTWTPYTRRPRQCASCRAPWWFPPKWRWHQGQARSR